MTSLTMMDSQQDTVESEPGPGPMPELEPETEPETAVETPKVPTLAQKLFQKLAGVDGKIKEKEAETRYEEFVKSLGQDYKRLYSVLADDWKEPSRWAEVWNSMIKPHPSAGLEEAPKEGSGYYVDEVRFDKWAQWVKSEHSGKFYEEYKEIVRNDGGKGGGAEPVQCCTIL